MPYKTRRATRKNRKNMRGAGFFDFFKPKAAAPPVNAPTLTNTKAPLNTSLPVTPNTPTVAPAPRRSFLNRIRGARNRAVGSLRTVRNTARNYGSAMRSQMNVLRNKTIRNQMYSQ
jgi:hypothetical protein